MNLFSDILTCIKTQLIEHPYSCLMLAAIQYNNAMFHIFSGPLFANVQGYAYLDLLIWGISPMLFLLFRPIILSIIKIRLLSEEQISQIRKFGSDKAKILSLIKNHEKDLFRYHKRRMYLLIGIFVCIFISFLFMNYSQTFNWNYFTRVINLDFGYLLFDFSCRSMTMIVQVQQQEQVQQPKRFNTKIQQSNIQVDKVKCHNQCQIYCKFRNTAAFLSYFIIFIMLSSEKFDIKHRYSGQNVLAICSIISSFVTLLIPLLYYFHFKNKYFYSNNFSIINKFKNNYTQLQQGPQSQDTDQIQMSDQIQISKIMCYFLKLSQKQNNPCSPPTFMQKQQIQDEDQHNAKQNSINKNSFMNTLRQMQDHSVLKLFLCYVSVTFSLIINISYLSLWIMETLKDQQSYVQYNQTLLIGSTFFMVAAPLNYYSSIFNMPSSRENQQFESAKQLKQLHRLHQYQHQTQQYNITKKDFSQKRTYKSELFNKSLLLLSSLILFFSFFLQYLAVINLQDKLILLILSTILLGFNISLFNSLTFKLQNRLDDNEIDLDLDVAYLYMETIAYLVIPIVIFILNLNVHTYKIYGYISSICLLWGTITI